MDGCHVVSTTRQFFVAIGHGSHTWAGNLKGKLAIAHGGLLHEGRWQGPLRVCLS